MEGVACSKERKLHEMGAEPNSSPTKIQSRGSRRACLDDLNRSVSNRNSLLPHDVGAELSCLLLSFYTLKTTSSDFITETSRVKSRRITI